MNISIQLQVENERRRIHRGISSMDQVGALIGSIVRPLTIIDWNDLHLFHYPVRVFRE